ncbi:chromophore lyase CpcT/CpeT [Hirschia litorea]|uniref:Chromophore lyase CpcT/CpeT n=1 Tax=Hirschia litorea TaxID=1199156 RepID=A0ABW2IHS6_9PROT
MKRLLPILTYCAIATLSLTACTSTAGSLEKNNASNNIHELSELLIRHFEIANDADSPGLVDRRVQVHSPHLKGIWYYSQLDKGNPQTLYRQRLNHLKQIEHSSNFVLITYRLKTPESYVNGWLKQDILNELKVTDFEDYFEDGCDQIWRKVNSDEWTGYVDPKTCKLFSERRQMHISIESEARLTSEMLQISERGFDEAGLFLWGSKIGELLTLDVIKPQE